MTPRLPTTLDRDIDTLLPCSGPAPLARPSGRDLWRRRESTREAVRPSALGNVKTTRVLVRPNLPVGRFYKIAVFY